MSNFVADSQSFDTVITWSITVLTGCLIIALLAPIPLVRKYLFLMK